MTTAPEQAQRVDTLRWVITHSCAGWSDERIRTTSAWKELAELRPDDPLVLRNRAARIEQLEEIVSFHAHAGDTLEQIESRESYRELVRLHPMSSTLRAIR
jgi:hypothetical protein